MYRKEYTERKHVIDFLFPLALFFALAASSVALVVLASGSYSRQVHTSEDSYASCTALSYVTEKLHQADSSDAIDAGTFDGQDAILIRPGILRTVLRDIPLRIRRISAGTFYQRRGSGFCRRRTGNPRHRWIFL